MLQGSARHTALTCKHGGHDAKPNQGCPSRQHLLRPGRLQHFDPGRDVHSTVAALRHARTGCLQALVLWVNVHRALPNGRRMAHPAWQALLLGLQGHVGLPAEQAEQTEQQWVQAYPALPARQARSLQALMALPGALCLCARWPQSTGHATSAKWVQSQPGNAEVLTAIS